MRSIITVTLIAVIPLACTEMPTGFEPPIPDTVTIENVRMTAHLEETNDQLTVTVELTNLREDTAEVWISGLCKVGLLAYRTDIQRDTPVWSEREMVPCADVAEVIRLAPKDSTQLVHSISKSYTNGRGEPIPPGRLFFAAQVPVFTSEVVLSAGKATIP